MTRAQRVPRLFEWGTRQPYRSASCAAASGKSGYSLLELVAVLAVTSLIAVIATSLLVSILQHNSVLGSQLRIDNSQRQLANRFRQDVHAARSYELTKAGIVLRGDDLEVTYSYGAGFVQRATSLGGKQRQHHFDMDRQHSAEFSATKLDGRDLIELTISMDETKLDTAERLPVANSGMRTVAELARNHRWAVKESTP